MQVPVDLVIDHSVQVDVARSENAVQANMELEFQRNKERFAFLKWGSNAFHNMLVVPPGSGIVHQVSKMIHEQLYLFGRWKYFLMLIQDRLSFIILQLTGQPRIPCQSRFQHKWSSLPRQCCWHRLSHHYD